MDFVRFIPAGTYFKDDDRLPVASYRNIQFLADLGRRPSLLEEGFRRKVDPFLLKFGKRHDFASLSVPEVGDKPEESRAEAAGLYEAQLRPFRRARQFRGGHLPLAFLSRGMAYEISGTVKAIFDTQTFSSGFSKREFVITTPDKFPQDVKLECLKDKTSLLDDLAEGQSVKVHFDINGREYNGRYFVNLIAWRIEADKGESVPGKPATDRKAEGANPEDTNEYAGEDEPF